MVQVSGARIGHKINPFQILGVAEWGGEEGAMKKSLRKKIHCYKSMNFQKDSASLDKQVCMPFYKRDHWESVHFKLNSTLTFLLDLAASLFFSSRTTCALSLLKVEKAV